MKDKLLQLLFVATLATTAGAATVKLELVHTETLPSIPVEFSVVVTNDSLSPIKLPSCIWMAVEKGSGSREYLKPHGGLPARCSFVEPARRIVAAGEAEEFLFDIRSLPVGTFLQDPQLHKPGTYRLRAVLSDDGQIPESLNELESNEAILNVRLLSESDVAAWQWLQHEYDDWSSNGWSTKVYDISRQLIARYPDSNYVPYVVLGIMGMPADEWNPLIEDAITRFPDSPFRPELMLYLAEWHQRQFKRYLIGDQMESALSELSTARKWATEVLRSQSVAERRRAEDLLRVLPNPRDLRSQG